MKQVLAAVFLCLAGPASALSCLQPDALRLYTEARDSEDIYSLVIGKLVSEHAVQTPTPDDKTPTQTTVTLVGRSLDRDGFKRPFQRDITLSLSCLSIWCASPPPSGAEVFAALRHDGDDRLLELSPCPSNALPWTGDDEARILNCHLFQACE